jgi:hypothetical protein
MRLLPILFLAAACAAGPPPGEDEAALSSELAGRAAGSPQDCVSASPGSGLAPRDARTLVLRRGDVLWVNRLAAACPGLDPATTLIVESHDGRYCRGDRISALDPGHLLPGPPCLLGPFTPYRR